jgi:hypothetical protein
VRRPQYGDPADEVALWRVRSTARAAAGVLMGAFVIVAIGVSAEGEAIGVQLAIWGAVVVLGFGVWRWSFAPYIELTQTEVVVQNPLVRRTILYAEVDDVRTAIGGLEVRRHVGKPVAVWAVQKSTWAMPSRRTARIDEVADAIRGRLRQVRTPAK